ncbi:MAG: DUF177 domain-containing protein [Deltaproteobacteria bacterium]|nr:DUF177 domain-containing protein [Deltaproteobacteria bacterium]
MYLKLTEISEDGQNVDQLLKRSWLTEILKGAGSVEFKVVSDQSVAIRVQRMGLDILVNSNFKLEFDSNCAACLTKFRLQVPVVFSTTLRPKPKQADMLPQDLELAAEDLVEQFYEGDNIDLTKILREQIILALPMYPRCKEDCRGLCSACGANLNERECGCNRGEIDPRWAALKTVTKN